MTNMSQEEIDRMLRAAMEGSGTAQTEDAAQEPMPGASNRQPEELSVIGGRLMEAGAEALQAALQKPVTVTLAHAGMETLSDVLFAFRAPMRQMEGTITRGLSGGVLLLLKEKDAVLLSDLIKSGTGTDESSKTGTDALARALHKMSDAQDVVLSEMMKSEVQTVMGELVSVSPENAGMLRWAGESEPLAVLHFDMGIAGAMQVKIVQILSPKTADSLMNVLNREGEAGTTGTGGEPHMEEAPVPNDIKGALVSEAPQEKPEQTIPQGRGEIRNMKTRDQKGVQNMRYQSFDQKKEQRLSAGMHENIGMIIDMPLQVTVELGKVRMSIKEILAFTLGSIVELDRMAEDLVDVKVNGKLIARGEIVVVDENYGVRITDIVSPERRVKSY